MLQVEDKSGLDLNHELFEEQVMEDTQSKKQKCAAPLHPSHSVHNLPETRMLSSALSSPIWNDPSNEPALPLAAC